MIGLIAHDHLFYYRLGLIALVGSVRINILVSQSTIPYMKLNL